VTPEDLAEWHGVSDWDEYFNDLARFAIGKPIYFAGNEASPGDPAMGVWVVPPPSGAEVFEFLLISRDGRLRRGKMIVANTGDDQHNQHTLQAMINRTEEIDD
jgi:hypothetical protein